MPVMHLELCQDSRMPRWINSLSSPQSVKENRGIVAQRIRAIKKTGSELQEQSRESDGLPESGRRAAPSLTVPLPSSIMGVGVQGTPAGSV